MSIGERTALTSAGLAVVVLLLALGAVSVAYITSTQSASDQIAVQNQQLANVKAQLQQLAAEQRQTVANFSSIAAALPSVNQRPTVRVITVEWAEFISKQDRFFTNFIIVNAGDAVDVTFISNDTASHTFTIDKPYNFQINGSVPGTVDDPTGRVFTTEPTNTNGTCTSGSRAGNVTCDGTFTAKYPGIYEYYCIYHIHLGMFGYLVVLPNAAYSQGQTTTTTTTTSISGTHISIGSGAGSSTNPRGYVPDIVTVVVGVNNTVTWTNDDSIDHTVTSLTGIFNSQVIPPGGSYSYTFTTPGNFSYGCEFHPLMTGTIVVKA